VVRRNLTPPVGTPVPGLPPTRRAGGARQNVSYRVAFLRADAEITGWALNLSRGGLRAVVEDRVQLGEELDIRIEEIRVERRGQVVWTQEEPDGTIVGIAFHERIEDPPSGVELESSQEIAPGALAARLGVTPEALHAMLDDTTPPKPPGDSGDGSSGGGAEGT
jgi:hypothetical protein